MAELTSFLRTPMSFKWILACLHALMMREAACALVALFAIAMEGGGERDAARHYNITLKGGEVGKFHGQCR